MSDKLCDGLVARVKSLVHVFWDVPNWEESMNFIVFEEFPNCELWGGGLNLEGIKCCGLESAIENEDAGDNEFITIVELLLLVLLKEMLLWWWMGFLNRSCCCCWWLLLWLWWLCRLFVVVLNEVSWRLWWREKSVIHSCWSLQYDDVSLEDEDDEDDDDDDDDVVELAAVLFVVVLVLEVKGISGFSIVSELSLLSLALKLSKMNFDWHFGSVFLIVTLKLFPMMGSIFSSVVFVSFGDASLTLIDYKFYKFNKIFLNFNTFLIFLNKPIS